MALSSHNLIYLAIKKIDITSRFQLKLFTTKGEIQRVIIFEQPLFETWITHPPCRRHNTILMFYTTSESNNSKINLDRRTPTALGDMGTTSDADLHFIHSSPSNSDNSLYRVAKQVQSIWYQIYL